jgi:hypothetical protein
MGNEDRVHPFEGNADGTEARLQHGEGFATGHARIDDGDTAFVLENVHIDVTETRKIDG